MDRTLGTSRGGLRDQHSLSTRHAQRAPWSEQLLAAGVAKMLQITTAGVQNLQNIDCKSDSMCQKQLQQLLQFTKKLLISNWTFKTFRIVKATLAASV